MEVGSIASNEITIVTDALLKAAEKQQTANAQNVANWMVPGAKAVELDQSFGETLTGMINAGQFDQIKNLEASLVSSGKSIDYQEVMHKTKQTSADHQFLIQLRTTSVQQILTAITGRT